MKFKERLWQLFLAIVVGITLSVCDAGLEDDELESSALVAGNAIASDDSSSTSVTLGDNWVKIGDFMLLHGSYTALTPTERDAEITIQESYNSNTVLIVSDCSNVDGTSETDPIRHQTNTIAKMTNNLGRMNTLHPTNCNTENRKVNFTILGKYK